MTYRCEIGLTSLLGSEANNVISEKTSLNPTIPARSTSQQQSSSLPPLPPNPEENHPPPSPRRGSKRSLITRSRQGSRSSRRSARHAAKALESRDPVPPVAQNDAARPKQKSGGFLSFLNCCRADEDLDTLKSEDADVPAKQRKIEPTPQRAGVPDEPADTMTSEKTQTQSQQSPTLYNDMVTVDPATIADEKTTISEKPREGSRPGVSRNEISHEKSSAVAAPIPVAIPTINTTQPDAPVQAETSRQADAQPVVATSSTAVEPIPTEQKPQMEFPPPPRDDRRESDIEMTDAPVPPVEKQNVVDEPLQPHDVVPVPLPPPPPLQKRMRETQPGPEVPPVPDPEPESKQQWLLPPAQPPLKGRKCLILDLDETLVHSSFKILNQADFTIPVEIEGQYHNVYVIKRPGVDQFMKRVGELY